VAELEQAFVAGADDALRAVFDRYGRLVYSYCRQLLGDETDAAEATQDVFVAAWRSQHRFDPDRGPLAAWLLGIARHRSVDALRRRTRRHPPVDPARMADAQACPDPGPDAVAARFVLADALARLPARARQVVTLAVVQGHSHHDVAIRLDLPLGTVKSDVRRSLSRLRRHLVDAEVAGVDT
jgi:RNA polymerase sigma-70 factor (ECF subfamily)